MLDPCCRLVPDLIPGGCQPTLEILFFAGIPQRLRPDAAVGIKAPDLDSGSHANAHIPAPHVPNRRALIQHTPPVSQVESPHEVQEMTDQPAGRRLPKQGPNWAADRRHPRRRVGPGGAQRREPFRPRQRVVVEKADDPGPRFFKDSVTRGGHATIGLRNNAETRTMRLRHSGESLMRPVGRAVVDHHQLVSGSELPKDRLNSSEHELAAVPRRDPDAERRSRPRGLSTRAHSQRMIKTSWFGIRQSGGSRQDV